MRVTVTAVSAKEGTASDLHTFTQKLEKFLAHIAVNNKYLNELKNLDVYNNTYRYRQILENEEYLTENHQMQKILKMIPAETGEYGFKNKYLRYVSSKA